MKWILKMDGIFEYKVSAPEKESEAVYKFLESFKHIGVSTKKLYDYEKVENDEWHFIIEMEFEIESDCIDKDDVVTEFFENLEYDGVPLELNYEVRKKAGV